MSHDLPLIHPDWPAPERVKALCTTRSGGVSGEPWSSFNLGDRVGDNHGDVLENRRRLALWAHQAEENFAWLNQVHGTTVVDLPASSERTADGSVTASPGVVCVVLTADCLPVLFCRRDGSRVAAAHAGWRGLAGGVLEQALGQLGPAGDVMSWLGPAIGPQRFEVGPEVRDRFVDGMPEVAACFAPSAGRPGHFLADLYALATFRLRRAGVGDVYGGGWCTMNECDRFYSYRRDGQTGRMASCIWIES